MSKMLCHCVLQIAQGGQVSVVRMECYLLENICDCIVVKAYTAQGHYHYFTEKVS